MKQEHNRLYLFSICALLVLSTIIAYEQVRHNDFVSYDDGIYVKENSHVKDGITLKSIIWAFTSSHSANWHPVTWLSHMLDCEIYGLNPSGHHLTSLLIHIANTLLLFWVLRRMTGTIWRSAFVAAAFALHPLHVESVAWAAERKDVLSGFFWMLTMLAYVRYAERPGVKRYMLVLLAFVLGLMSKPMVVTLPFVLLLLDWWPLDRIAKQGTKEQQTTPACYKKKSLVNLVVEKVPMIVLSAISSVITFIFQKTGGAGAVENVEARPFPIRIVNALGCYFDYIVKMLYPKGLAVLYLPPEKMAIDAALLAVIGAAVLLVVFGRSRRWLVVGLLWYLGTLVPVIGLVQVGFQVMADRYTYLPSIGVFIIVAWGAAEVFSKLPHSKPALAAAGAAAVVAMVIVTRIQVGYWRDNITLYGHAVAVTKNNFMMYYNYGTELCKLGRYEEGIQHLEETVRLRPAFIPARYNIGLLLLKQQRYNEAIVCLTELLRIRPDHFRAYGNLAAAYLALGRYDEAIQNYKEALRLQPDSPEARQNLEVALKLKELAQTNEDVKNP
ncbi:MAG: tetratricopeptide repeat protein [Sedimentisphaerales bacterium]|nr:tetratricopeptide repeat protein [Sedimentisphaerales bacterium]